MKKTIFTIAIFSFAIIGKAQSDTNTDSHTIGVTIPSFAIIDIEPAASKNITMNFIKPTEAGSALTPPADNTSLWLNYSVIPSATDKKAKVSVAIDPINDNIDFKLLVASASGTASGGTLGTNNSSTILLSATPQDIITGIGASFTGDGINNGHNLTYSLGTKSTAYSSLVASNSIQTTVTYTISE